MNVYFVRHGQSQGNKNNQHQGPDVPLSPEGIQQARLVARRLKKVPIDLIYASPYLRAQQTAAHISKQLKLPVETWDHLRERKRPTQMEGLNFDHPIAAEIGRQWTENQHRADWKHSDDESFNDMKNRTQEVIVHLLQNYRDQNVLCVSHGAIMKMIVLSMIYEEQLTPQIFWQFFYHSHTENTGITHCEYTDRWGWSLNSWNDTRHL